MNETVFNYTVSELKTLAPQCKCIIPEAVIPTHWRMIMVLNLVFTSIVYLTFVVRNSQAASIESMLAEIRQIKKQEALKTFRTFMWILLLVVLLVQPWVATPYSILQMALIFILFFSMPD